MTANFIHLTSLDSVVAKVVAQLKERHDTALIAAPGCGATTLSQRIKADLNSSGIQTFCFDVRSAKDATEAIREISAIQSAGEGERQPVLFLDHAAKLLPDDFKGLIENTQLERTRIAATCLWIGSLDARAILNEVGVRIHAVPKSHISFPVLPRDELLAVYRSIAEANGCRWGEAILFLLLDLCGNDLSLVQAASAFLHGDWSDKLYDVSVWDRIADWLAHSEAVSDYRERLNRLPDPCNEYLGLTRLGGKPPCLRTELLEEVDAALRQLCLHGFLSQNLLPGYYQLRNLTIRYLVHEPFEPWNASGPKILFRRATNERAGQLLQDVETMLRAVLLSLFHFLGPENVRGLLEAKQGDSEFISAGLNKALFEWVDKNGGQDIRQSLNALLLEHRKVFKVSNSVWARVTLMMREDKDEEDEKRLPEHLRCIDYLTFAELGDILIDQLETLFPSVDNQANAKNRLKERWRENISKIRRLRNRVAHLRNVDFQDMEDLVGTVESMRRDLLHYGVWK